MSKLRDAIRQASERRLRDGYPSMVFRCLPIRKGLVEVTWPNGEVEELPAPEWSFERAMQRPLSGQGRVTRIVDQSGNGHDWVEKKP